MEDDAIGCRLKGDEEEVEEEGVDVDDDGGEGGCRERKNSRRCAVMMPTHCTSHSRVTSHHQPKKKSRTTTTHTTRHMSQVPPPGTTTTGVFAPRKKSIENKSKSNKTERWLLRLLSSANALLVPWCSAYVARCSQWSCSIRSSVRAHISNFNPSPLLVHRVHCGSFITHILFTHTQPPLAYLALALQFERQCLAKQ